MTTGRPIYGSPTGDTSDSWENATRKAPAIADRDLLSLLDQALDLPAEKDPLRFLLSQLPVAQHLRAMRLLVAAQITTAEGGGATALLADNPLLRWLGRRIGPYEVISLIGEGEMGHVFLAERVDSELNQRVALKVIRNANLNEKAIDRFQAECQILAGLQHPNIARLLDGGTTQDGLPYTVTENVTGEPIDLYLRRFGLPLNARLRLFIDFCAAVEHAHRAHLIHRNIKPSNILVTPQGTPKLLDFGIAKPIAHSVTGQIQDSRSLIPPYASPERVAGSSLTAATDVYSLGVVLYECLTDQRPYVVVESEPILPSLCLLEQGVDRGNKLKGDLDAIVMRALAKEPDRRYSSAAALSDDIRRFLAQRPVSAQPDARKYRLGRLIHRWKAWIMARSVRGKR